MSTRYIPPHLRSTSTTTPQAHNPSNSYTSLEIATRFHLSPQLKPGTLNASSEDPDTLSFILIFKDQHPDWPTKGELLCKTNLHLLSPLTSNAIDGTISAAEEGGTELTPTESKGSGTTTSTPNSSSIPPPLLNQRKVTLPTHPIPLFAQQASPSYTANHTARFIFNGHYRLRSLAILPPRSAALIKLLDRKFTAMDMMR
ncbi:MAG: hypothetical protein Q9170_007893, partial [Blastenia crenularia]